MPEIVLALLEHAADVVVLSEFRATTGGQIAGVLADHGWKYQASTVMDMSRTGRGATGHLRAGNGMLVASRAPLRVVAQEREGLGHAACERRYLEVEISGLGMALAGVHIPCDGKGLGREAVFGQVLAAARRRRGEGFVILGDFNAGRHYLDEVGARFTCTRCLGQLASLGYVDAWREVSGERREFSWFSHEGAGVRIDHAFVSQTLRPRLTGCWYSHGERERGLSDHSALVVEVGGARAGVAE
jgi:exodeoxyribonuclease III